MKTRIILLLLGCINVLLAFGNNEHFQQANDLYTKGEYKAAAEMYQKLVDNNYESAALYFNLGNSYYKQNAVAEAILYYEKAKKLAPHDNDIQFNLDMANLQITDKIEPIPTFFLTSFWINLLQLSNMDGWAWITVISLFTVCVLFTLFTLSSEILWRKVNFYSGLMLLLVALFSLYAAFSQHKIVSTSNYAIVFTPTLNVKSSPGNTGKDLFVIHEGTKVQLLEQTEEDWYKIILADGNVGWLKKTDIKLI